MECGENPILECADYMAKRVGKHQIRSATLMILYDLQIPLNYDGFGYLKCAIPIAYQNHTQIVASEIYDAVGQLYTPRANSRNIDTALRDAIQKAWKNRNQEKWNCYLPAYLMDRRKPPSNLEFISAMVYFLELWQDCYEKEVSHERV